MTALRDALATALHNCAESGETVIGDYECYCRRIATVDGSRDGRQSDDWGQKEYDPEDWGQTAGEPTGCERDAATILADPAFRAALVQAVEDGLTRGVGWHRAGDAARHRRPDAGPPARLVPPARDRAGMTMSLTERLDDWRRELIEHHVADGEPFPTDEEVLFMLVYDGITSFLEDELETIEKIDCNPAVEPWPADVEVMANDWLEKWAKSRA